MTGQGRNQTNGMVGGLGRLPCGRLAALERGLLLRRTRRGVGIFVTEVDATFGQVIRGHLHGHAVALDDLDAVHLHLAGDIGDDGDAVFEGYHVTGVRQNLGNNAFKFNKLFFGHSFFQVINFVNKKPDASRVLTTFRTD
jgi:hypothetical protein